MIQKKTFTNGMDWDTTDELLPQGKDRLRLNVRVMSSDNGSDGAIETMNGNTLVTFSLPAGTNTEIGSKEDPLRRRIYYFIHNSSNNHCILEYDSIAGTIATVFQNSLLNFSTDYLITGIDIVALNSTNHLLYWTDNLNEPRKINIEKAKYYTAGNYTDGYPTPFEARWITQIKQPPQTPPTSAWSTDAAQVVNFLFKKLFTFKVLFVYDDNEESSYSPISKYAYPVTVCDPTTGEDIQTQNNLLTVTVPTGSAIVRKIRIAAKEVNALNYSVIAELDKDLMGIANDSTYAFDFYNNANYVPVEVNQSIKLFDNVPQLAKSQTLISGNRMTWGLITEGYNPVDVDSRFTLSYVVPSFPVNPDFFPKQTYLKSGGAYLLGFIYYDEYGNRSGVTNVVNEKTTNLIDPAVNVYGTRLFVPFLTDPLYAAPHATPNTDMSYVPLVSAEVYHQPPAWAKYYQIARSKNETMGRYLQFAIEAFDYLSADYVPTTAGAAVYVSISIANITGRYLYENKNSKLVYDYATGDRIRFIANNDWSVYVPGVSYAPASSTAITSFFTFNDTEIMSYDQATNVLLIKKDSAVPTTLREGALFEIYQPSENAIDSNEIMYEMGECRAITTDSHGNRVHAGTANQLITTFSGSTYVAPTFIATVPSGHGLLVNDKVKVVTTGYSVFGIVTVSGATSVTIDTTGFTLVGVFNGATAGTITRAATFDLSGGDTYRRYQNMPFVITIGAIGNVRRLYQYVEAENASNMFPSKAWNVGRPNRVDPEYRQIVRPATIPYSEAFIPETFINGLSTVYDTSFQSYEDKYGGIYKLSNRNHQLTVYQEIKVGAILVGQVIFNGTDGGEVVGQSADVLPEVMKYYEGDYGIGKHPESHAVHANVEYFADVNSGTPVRLSTDGLTPIGDIAFMRNFFTDYFQAILAVNSRIKINGVFDVKFNEYIIAIDGFTSRNVSYGSKTLAFNEKTNEWSTFYSFNPDGMCTDGINIVSFKAGALYTHNTNSAVATFYGVQYPPQIWMYLNDNPSNVKILEAMEQESLLPWEVTSISTPGGQESSLATTDFTLLEGLQYAPVLRDSNTPNVTAPELAIFAGDPMRDRTFLLKLRWPLTTYNKLFAVNLKYIISNLHNR